MKIRKVSLKQRYNLMNLWLIGDEQKELVLNYIEKGDAFVIDNNGIIAGCICVEYEKKSIEIKNIATFYHARNQGYAKTLINFICSYYNGKTIFIGTGESLIPFYQKLGFKYSHTLKDFFTNNYDHEIIEDGIRLIDMIYLKK